jgi:hypothetical protein
MAGQTMTAANIIADIRTQTLVSSTAVTDNEVLAWLNEGVAEVASTTDWPWLQASGHVHTVANQAYATIVGVHGAGIIGADVERIIAITPNGALGNGRLQQVSPYEALNEYSGKPSSAQWATHFYTWAGLVYFLPTPTTISVYDVLYIKTPTALASTSSTPEWNGLFHHILVHYGEWRMWQREEDLDKANEAHAQFYRVLAQMIAWYSPQHPVGPIVIGSGGIRSGAVLTNTPFVDGL